eukprot:scaffold111817_cov18-Prasinocladus_malaysianus.AAC.2
MLTQQRANTETPTCNAGMLNHLAQWSKNHIQRSCGSSRRELLDDRSPREKSTILDGLPQCSGRHYL